jgi:hypothetical protein
MVKTSESLFYTAVARLAKDPRRSQTRKIIFAKDRFFAKNSSPCEEIHGVFPKKSSPGVGRKVLKYPRLDGEVRGAHFRVPMPKVQSNL